MVTMRINVPDPFNFPLVVNGKVIAPKPFGPKNASGQDAFEAIMMDRIGNNVSFIDDWSTYHLAYGEVHCGTNVKRTPPAVNWWDD